ncbi:DUF3309 family protein [Gluconobacter sphaericus]|uniref:DUF3309 family protein n=1 Tax=Gluconobacter sphaericus TaxID=574987 RepID=UPI003075E562
MRLGTGLSATDSFDLSRPYGNFLDTRNTDQSQPAREMCHGTDPSCNPDLGALPSWPYSSKWDSPSSGLVLIVVVVILVLMGQI